MSLYIQREGNPIKIGYEIFPERKRPQLVVWDDCCVACYGSFKNEAAAIKFMSKLCDLTGAVDAE